MRLASEWGAPAEIHKPAGRSFSSPWAAALLILIALIPSFFKLAYYPHNPGSDDAFIHLQVARNVAGGRGWGINPDQPVNMSTSPVFTLLTAAAEKLAVLHAIGVMQLFTCAAGACGIFLIYLRVAYRAGASWVPFAAAAISAFSLNLWRWNGVVMEAIAGFAAVSLVLYLFRDWRSVSLPACLRNGFILGLCVLVRPELLLAGVLAAFLMALLGRPGRRVFSSLLLAVGIAAVVGSWLWFSRLYFGSFLPTTYYAKSAAPPILWNAYLIRQMVGLAAESYLWPCLLLGVLLAAAVRLGLAPALREELLFPAGLLLAILAFYYLRTRGVESMGRYLLPFEPCLVCVIAILLSAVAARDGARCRRLAAAFLALHIATAALVNHFFLAPHLASFNGEYRATMEAAAGYLAVHTTPQDRVLIASDIGVVSWTANGRFRILDTGALATPEMRGLNLEQQLERARPRYLVVSLAAAEDVLLPRFSDSVELVWQRRFRQHGLWASLDVPYNFTEIYRIRPR